ncbi:MAG: hypothetical protein IID41_00545 [Planctomycetes bacterium]|nr:hypothetical protein [Planctomycetota bacterium]
MTRRKYYVTTWDTELEKFTPQKGVRTGPHSWRGLRRALRALQELGYPANRGDPSTLVESAEASERSGAR